MSLIFSGKDRSLPLVQSYVSCTHVGSSFASKIKIRMKVTNSENALAYYITQLIMSVKGFIIEAYCGI